MPVADLTQHPVFVLGSVRSGTSVVALSLLKCGRYEGFGEGHLLPLVDELLATTREYYDKISPSDHTGSLLTHTPLLTFEKAIRQIFVHLTRAKFPSGYWVDKTPSLKGVLTAPLMREIWPNARFIFVQRRLLENLVSRLRKFPECSLEHHYREWVDVLQSWRKVHASLADCSIVIEQMELARSPDRVGAELAEFLELPASCAAELRSFLALGRPEQTSASIEARETLDLLGISSADREALHAFCDPTMIEFGYSYGTEYYSETGPIRAIA